MQTYLQEEIDEDSNSSVKGERPDGWHSGHAS